MRPLPEHPPDTELVVTAIVSKEARVRLDTNSYSVPHEFVGKTVFVRADDHTVRVVADSQEIARHARCWDRRRSVEDPAHVEKLIQRRPGATGSKRKDRIAALSPECRVYLQQVARRRINLESEVRKLVRLVDRYSEAEVADGIARALAARTLGANYVRAFIDQARFARGLGEPPEPIVTGNPTADALNVEPHALETYDALFEKPETTDPNQTEPGTRAADPDRGDDSTAAEPSDG